MVSCDRCGQDMVEKRREKKDGSGTFYVYQCTTGCKEGKWPYSIPEWELKKKGAQKSNSSKTQTTVVKPNEDAIKLLGGILNELREIKQELALSRDPLQRALDNPSEASGS